MKTFAGEGGYLADFCLLCRSLASKRACLRLRYELPYIGWREHRMLRKFQKNLAFTLVKCFSTDCYSDVMIAVTVAATVTCPPAFLGYCRNSELRLLFILVAGADFE